MVKAIWTGRLHPTPKSLNEVRKGGVDRVLRKRYMLRAIAHCDEGCRSPS